MSDFTNNWNLMLERQAAEIAESTDHPAGQLDLQDRHRWERTQMLFSMLSHQVYSGNQMLLNLTKEMERTQSAMVELCRLMAKVAEESVEEAPETHH